MTIWHGTEDTWAPLSLSEALANALNGDVELRQIEGLGHYSALKVAIEEITQ
ncbi:MAG: hypothetical protein AAFR74_06860 [Pseudomonadota bacterium]